MILFNGYTEVGPIRWFNPDVPGKCEHGHHPADCLLCFKASEDAAKGRFGAVALERAFSRPVAW